MSENWIDRMVDTQLFPEKVMRENRVFSPDGSRRGADLQKLAERLSSSRWEVADDDPITIRCGNLLIKIVSDMSVPSRTITRIRDKLDLLEYLMSVQPYKYLELCGTCSTENNSEIPQNEGEQK